MALYVIGDLHLSLGGDKPMDVFGPRWAGYVDRLRESFSALTPEDTTVLCGDLSWAMSLETAGEDFAFIDALPGRKLMLKGNHDYWWSTASKAYRCFAERGFETLSLLHNNCALYGDLALCGTRGWFYEEEKGGEHDRKIMLREIGRLENSLRAAGAHEKYVFLHYPPVYGSYRCEEILSLFDRYSVRRCYYGHLHGAACRAAFEGTLGGTEYRLISADHVAFVPQVVTPLAGELVIIQP